MPGLSTIYLAAISCPRMNGEQEISKLFHISQPMAVGRVFTFHDIEIALLDFGGDGPRSPMPISRLSISLMGVTAAVPVKNTSPAAACRGDAWFFNHRQAHFFGDGNHALAGDAVERHIQGGGVEPAFVYHENVFARAFGHIALRIEQNGFAVAAAGGFGVGQNRIQILPLALALIMWTVAVAVKLLTRTRMPRSRPLRPNRRPKARRPKSLAHHHLRRHAWLRH